MRTGPASAGNLEPLNLEPLGARARHAATMPGNAHGHQSAVFALLSGPSRHDAVVRMKMNHWRISPRSAAFVLVVLGLNSAGAASRPRDALELAPTDHPRLPVDPCMSGWRHEGAHAAHGRADAFIGGVKLEDRGAPRRRCRLSQPLLAENPLSDYVQYYKGRAELRLGRTADALRRSRRSTASVRSAICKKRRRWAKPNRSKRSANRPPPWPSTSACRSEATDSTKC